jgi:murein DD-endopeptidase MepM/ murein hydrolase activator NlpD
VGARLSSVATSARRGRRRGVAGVLVAVTSLVGGTLVAITPAAAVRGPESAGVTARVAGVTAPTGLRAPASHDQPPLLSYGDESESVKVVQRRLGVTPVSGFFGDLTKAAVMRFQKRQGIRQTGVVAELTWAALGPTAMAAAARVAPRGRVSNGWSCPAEYYWPGDGWGANRGSRRHTGFDMMGYHGTNLFAIRDGYVVRSGYQSWNGGLTLTLRTDRGDFFYGHQRDNIVYDGQWVHAGQLIAHMGDTGSPGAVHLHIEWWPYGWQGSGASSARDVEPTIRQIC